MLANVKIEQDKENDHIHRVFVDGKQIEKITHIDFEINPLETPRINIETMSGIDFDGQAEVNFLNTPFNIQNACEIIRQELMEHGDFYKAFSASIYSALKDIPGETRIEDMPQLIMDRIIGEDE